MCVRIFPLSFIKNQLIQQGNTKIFSYNNKINMKCEYVYY